MTDGNKKFFINTTTGEIVERKTKLGAYAYFKRDGRKLGYKVSHKDVITLKEFVARKIVDGLVNELCEEVDTEEMADGIA